MARCTHATVEFRELFDEDMHCWGWTCRRCAHEAPGECHHRTWCREDFCGRDPVGAEPQLAFA